MTKRTPVIQIGGYSVASEKGQTVARNPAGQIIAFTSPNGVVMIDEKLNGDLRMRIGDAMCRAGAA